jgi:hypothetical protein
MSKEISSFLPFFNNWKNLPHQCRAMDELWRAIPNHLKTRNAPWYKTWQTSDNLEEQPVLLNVPYYSQRDSATSQGDRMCFSSTCAMIAQYLNPGCLSGPNQPDDQYLRLVQEYGDTTQVFAQIQALKRLGIAAEMKQNGDLSILLERLHTGVPVPVGWLHRGTYVAPQGGGHWSLAVGWSGEGRRVIMHDPYGMADLMAGGYQRTDIGRGRSQPYPWAHWGRRWMVEGSGTGWWLKCDRM